MLQNKEIILIGANQQPFCADLTFNAGLPQKGTVVFCHGFKGFKDWGCWHLVANFFAEKGYCFFKFNFSHNGIGTDHLTDFTQLDKFSINTFQKEVADLTQVENFLLHQSTAFFKDINTENIFIIGHSKGGVSAILYTSSLPTQIKKVCTWASPFNFHKLWSDKFIHEWKEKGIQYIKNARTNQLMPLSMEILADYEANKEKYNLTHVSHNFLLALLVVHGTKDDAVPLSDTALFKQHFTKTTLCIISEANHVFGATHPYTKDYLPQHTEAALQKTLDFFNCK